MHRPAQYETAAPTAGLACPVCEAPTGRLFEKSGYWVRSCPACKHRHAEVRLDPATHVSGVYGEDYFFGGKDGYSNYFSGEQLLVAHGRRYASLLEKHAQPGRVLDVGAAAGFVLKGLELGGWQGTGLEPNAEMAEHAQQKLGLDLIVGTLERQAQEASPVLHETFDLVTFVQVIAHFHDLRSALDVAARVTRPGGLWLIETWDHSSLVARFFGKNWHEYSPPSVLHWFTWESLVRLVSQYGFEPVERGRPRKRIKGEHARSIFAHKAKALPLGKLLGSLKCLIPAKREFPYPAVDLFWGLFRKAP